MPKPQGSLDVARSICALIITLCIVAKHEYLDIECAVGIKKGTYSLIV